MECICFLEGQGGHPGQSTGAQGAGVQGSDRLGGAGHTAGAWAKSSSQRGPGQGSLLVPSGLRCGLTLRTAFTCPADKVYRPCGPSNPSYCYMNDSANTL